MKHLYLVAFLLTLSAHLPGQAQQSHGAQGGPASPYAGQQNRAIKALSTEEIKAYTEGMGFGFAKAAELNGYPGPMHTLELDRELGLSETQRSQTQALLAQHKTEARRIGAELIESERALDKAFANRTIDNKTLARLTAASGEKLAQLRAAHLQTHLAQTALLTPQQIERYQVLRGYGADGSAASDAAMHQHHGH